ncbi:MAG TPA: ABC transporter permease [Candidatus Bathyarchaeia archaeon]|nr:ABC transporter permease [Candidatus Bathyarchaeia archaeon]
MFQETYALTIRALRKWVRNPAAVLPGFFVALFYVLLLGSSFNPSKLIPAGAPASVAATILQQSFAGAPTYITYLVPGVICIILVFNMAFGGIDLVLDRQLGYLGTLLTAPIPRAAIFLSGVVQNLAKVMLLAIMTFLVALVIPNGLQLPGTFNVLDFIGVFGAFALLGLGLSFIFTALALAVRSIDSLVAIVNFLTLPMTFTSNTFYPLDSFPDWLKSAALINPISKANEAARLLIVYGGLSSDQTATFAADMVYLVAFAAALGILGYLAARRALRPE